jgi:ketosteroid isomerase-like protein
MRRDNLRLALTWPNALGSGDLGPLEAVLAPGVVWRGIPEGVACNGRDEVLALLRAQIAEGLPDAYALELVAGESGAVIGYRAAELTDVGDEPLPGQVFNVFTIRDGEIAAIEDFARREEALRAAGVDEPGWV